HRRGRIAGGSRCPTRRRPPSRGGRRGNARRGKTGRTAAQPRTRSDDPSRRRRGGVAGGPTRRGQGRFRGEVRMMQGGMAPGPGAAADGHEPDVLAPAEFTDLRARAALDRERLLMYAVLEDALSCYRQYAGSRLPRTRQLHQEAREWVASEDRT